MPNARLEVQVDDKGVKKLKPTLKETFDTGSKGAKALGKEAKGAQKSLGDLAKSQKQLIGDGRGVRALAKEYSNLAKEMERAAAAAEKLASQSGKAGGGKGGGKGGGGPGGGGAADGARRGAASKEERDYWKNKQQREDDATKKNEERQNKQGKHNNREMARVMALAGLAHPGDPSAPFGAAAQQYSTLGQAVSPFFGGAGAIGGAILSILAAGLNIKQQRLSRFMAYEGAERSSFGFTDGVGSGSGAAYGMSPEEGLSTVAGYSRASGGNVIFNSRALAYANMGLTPGVAEVGKLLGAGGIGRAGRGGAFSMSNDDRQAYVEQALGSAHEMARREASVFGGRVSPAKVEEHLARMVGYTQQLVQQGHDAVDPMKIAGMLNGLQGLGMQNLGAGVNANTFAGERGMSALQAMRGSTGEGGRGRLIGMMTALGRGENFFEALNSADMGKFRPDELGRTYQGVFGRTAAGSGYGWSDYNAKRVFGVNDKQGSAIARGNWDSPEWGPVRGKLGLEQYAPATADLRAVDARTIESGRGQVGGAAGMANTLFDMQTKLMNLSSATLPALQGLNNVLDGLAGSLDKLVDLLKRL